eukprot:COSAG02_NODE_2527_length_8604_cov_4.945209_7_plen_35_part_00
MARGKIDLGFMEAARGWNTGGYEQLDTVDVSLLT